MRSLVIIVVLFSWATSASCSEYQTNKLGDIVRSSDGAVIGQDPGNRDYVAYKKWKDAGNTPDAVPPPSAADVAEAARQADIRSDAGRADLLTRLKSATSAQIDSYIEANVTTIAQARALFKALLKTIALDGRQ